MDSSSAVNVARHDSPAIRGGALYEESVPLLPPVGLRDKIGAKVRDAFFFADLVGRFTQQDMLASRRVNRWLIKDGVVEALDAQEIGVPMGPLVGRAYEPLFRERRERLLVLAKTTVLHVHLVIFETAGGDPRTLNNWLMIGGKDANLDVMRIRAEPYLKAYTLHPIETQKPGFRLILMSFHNIELYGRLWRPETYSGFGDVFFGLLAAQATTERGQRIQTVIVNSVATAVFHGLERRDPELIPDIVIDRGKPSVLKAARQMFPWLHHLLLPFVRRFGWDGDPESSIVSTSKTPWRVVKIEAKERDFYFSGRNAWDSRFAALGDRGAEVAFSPSEVLINSRAVHACSPSKYKATEARRLASWFDHMEDEHVVQAVIRNMLMQTVSQVPVGAGIGTGDSSRSEVIRGPSHLPVMDGEETKT